MFFCKFCNDILVPKRAELGYTYCTKKQCSSKGFKPKTFIAVAVPKSTFFVEAAADDNPQAGLVAGRNPRRP